MAVNVLHIYFIKFKINFFAFQNEVRTDLSCTTLTKVESGVVNKSSVQTMAKIAKTLQANIKDLLK